MTRTLRRLRLFSVIVFREWHDVRLWPALAWKIATTVHPNENQQGEKT
jgi:hypothetical protein